MQSPDQQDNTATRAERDHADQHGVMKPLLHVVCYKAVQASRKSQHTPQKQKCCKLQTPAAPTSGAGKPPAEACSMATSAL
jgi:hypothetical protein